MLIAQAGKLKDVFITLCGLVLLAVTPWVTHEAWLQYRSQTWPTVQAFVTDVDVHYYTQSGGYLQLTYAYRLGGDLYTRTLEERVHKAYKVSAVKSRWDSYALGQKLVAYYQPDAPQKTFLPHEQVQSIWLPLALLLFIGGGGTLVTAVGWSALKVQKNLAKRKDTQKKML